MIERWKDIPGFEGHYQVSTLGRVMSIKNGRRNLMKIRTHTGIHDGIRQTRYMIVDLRKPGIKVKVFMHVLMARVYIPNPLGLPIVDHKNGDNMDFSLGNLEWVDESENSRRWRRGRKLAEEKEEAF